MKIKKRVSVTAIIVLLLLAGVLFMQPPQSPQAFVSSIKMPALLSDLDRDTPLPNATPAEPPQSREGFLPTIKVPAPLWNFFEDKRLQYLTPAHTFSGTIGGISSTKGSFVLTTTPTCGLPIVIDPEQRAAFAAHKFNVGDPVTVQVRTRISPSRKYGQYYLRSITPNQ